VLACITAFDNNNNEEVMMRLISLLILSMALAIIQLFDVTEAMNVTPLKQNTALIDGQTHMLESHVDAKDVAVTQNPVLEMKDNLGVNAVIEIYNPMTHAFTVKKAIYDPEEIQQSSEILNMQNLAGEELARLDAAGNDVIVDAIAEADFDER